MIAVLLTLCLIAVVALAAARLGWRLVGPSSDAGFEVRIKRLENQYDVLRPGVLPISTAFQTVLRQDLTHFHTPEMDALMVKLGPPYVLTEAEAARLVEMLAERARDVSDLISDHERDAATMLPMVIRRVRAEAEAAGSEPLVRIIIVADPPQEKTR
jgi:hypothetical protein